MYKTVVILGRINVGKSALFNFLTKTNEAIVAPSPGTTCDRKYGLVECGSQSFKLVDTGGVNLTSLKNSIFALAPRKTKIRVLSGFKGMFEKAIIGQIKIALKEADLLLMVVDGQEGLHPGDKDLAAVLKKINKPKIVVCNKIDKPIQVFLAEEFKRLGLGKPVAVSATNNKGRNILLKKIVETLQKTQKHENTKTRKQEGTSFSSPFQRGRLGGGYYKETEKQKDRKIPLSLNVPLKLVIIGKSGVGKSSLFNQILGKELAVVSDLYQTTVDSHDEPFLYKNNPILLIDTPGLLEKSDMRTDIDRIIYQKTAAILKKADAVLFVTEIKRSLCSTDGYLAYLVKRAKLPAVIMANKWDTFPRKDEEMVKQILIHYRNYLPKLVSAPIIFTSAKTGQGIKKALEVIINKT